MQNIWLQQNKRQVADIGFSSLDRRSFVTFLPSKAILSRTSADRAINIIKAYMIWPPPSYLASLFLRCQSKKYFQKTAAGTNCKWNCDFPTVSQLWPPPSLVDSCTGTFAPRLCALIFLTQQCIALNLKIVHFSTSCVLDSIWHNNALHWTLKLYIFQQIMWIRLYVALQCNPMSRDYMHQSL